MGCIVHGVTKSQTGLSESHTRLCRVLCRSQCPDEWMSEQEKAGPWVGVLLIPFVMPIVMPFTLSTLFAETRVGKARAKRLEGDSRSRWNCRPIYSLLADTAAIAADIT